MRHLTWSLLCCDFWRPTSPLFPSLSAIKVNRTAFVWWALIFLTSSLLSSYLVLLTFISTQPSVVREDKQTVGCWCWEHKTEHKLIYFARGVEFVSINNVTFICHYICKYTYGRRIIASTNPLSLLFGISYWAASLGFLSRQRIHGPSFFIFQRGNQVTWTPEAIYTCFV